MIISNCNSVARTIGISSPRGEVSTEPIATGSDWSATVSVAVTLEKALQARTLALQSDAAATLAVLDSVTDFSHKAFSFA
jgi:hypothetical protein